MHKGLPDRTVIGWFGNASRQSMLEVVKAFPSRTDQRPLWRIIAVVAGVAVCPGVRVESDWQGVRRIHGRRMRKVCGTVNRWRQQHVVVLKSNDRFRPFTNVIHCSPGRLLWRLFTQFNDASREKFSVHEGQERLCSKSVWIFDTE